MPLGAAMLDYLLRKLDDYDGFELMPCLSSYTCTNVYARNKVDYSYIRTIIADWDAGEEHMVEL